jgi:hypothetical protein
MFPEAFNAAGVPAGRQYGVSPRHPTAEA